MRKRGLVERLAAVAKSGVPPLFYYGLDQWLPPPNLAPTVRAWNAEASQTTAVGHHNADRIFPRDSCGRCRRQSACDAWRIAFDMAVSGTGARARQPMGRGGDTGARRGGTVVHARPIARRTAISAGRTGTDLEIVAARPRPQLRRAGRGGRPGTQIRRTPQRPAPRAGGGGASDGRAGPSAWKHRARVCRLSCSTR